MGNAIGNLFVVPTAAGQLISLAASVPAIGSIAADSFQARVTATITYWSSGATPNASVGLWVTPNDVWPFTGNVSKIIICTQGAGAMAFEFSIGGL